MAQWADPEVKVGMGDAGGAELHLLPAQRGPGWHHQSGTPTPVLMLLRAQGPGMAGILCVQWSLQGQCDPWTGAAPEPGVTEPNLRPRASLARAGVGEKGTVGGQGGASCKAQLTLRMLAS